ncbi:MAG: hypothetical protein MK202_00875 [Tenacibaculum sp.]|nr:hypothetical protein [Tenacibaculum sp.]
MKPLIIVLAFFFSLKAQKCSSQGKENLKINFVKKFILDNKDNSIYFNTKNLYFMGYEQNFLYEGYKVNFIDSKALTNLVKEKKKLYVFSISEPYIKGNQIKAYFNYITAKEGENKKMNVASLHGMNAMYCLSFNCDKGNYIVEWCGSSHSR